MNYLNGHKVLALGEMPNRPLARYLKSLGAEIIQGELNSLDDTFSLLIDDIGLVRLGLQKDELNQKYPNLIHVSVSCFGSYGVNAKLEGNEIIASAMAGSLRLCGTPDRAPVKEALDACTFHADMVGAAGAMAAHLSRGLSSKGQHVDVSIQEVAFSRCINGILVWNFDKRKLHRVGGALNYGIVTVRCIWPLKDGFCFHSLMTGRFGAPANQALSDWMDEVGVDNPLKGVDWIAYNRSTLPAETRAIWEKAIENFFRQITKEEMLDQGRKRGINACVVYEPEDVLNDEHLKARNFFENVNSMKLPTRFVSANYGPKSAPNPIVRSSRKGPLSGLKVLDFSWALVGSLTSKTLGDLGAEVIKVESRTRPCLTRLDVQVSASKAGNFDDKPWFAHLNTSKKSLSLNMKSKEWRKIIDPLIDWADIVVENFSPGTMDKLGLGYKDLVKLNPKIIMLSGSVYGQNGPLSQEWGVDGTGGALSGRTYLTGWEDRDPVIPGAVPYGDVIVPYVMAASVCAALEERRKTGESVHIDASMWEICVQQMYDAYVKVQNGEHPKRMGNNDMGYAYQDVVYTKDDDRFVAICCKTKAEFDKLVALTGSDIAAFAKRYGDYELAKMLQNQGIIAAPLQDMEDIFTKDEMLQVRGTLPALEHPYLGSFGHLKTPILFSRDEFAPIRAPSIGEHNFEIGEKLAGLSLEELNELAANGVFE